MGRHGGVDEWREIVAAHLTAAPVRHRRRAVVAVAESPVPREHIEIAAFFLARTASRDAEYTRAPRAR